MYGNTHRRLLQHLLANPYISLDSALEFCNNIQEDFQGLDDLRLLISEVNDKIQAQRLKILVTRCEVTDAETVIVQTLASDDVSKTQDSFAAVELEYFQTVLREIVTADERRFQAIACINLVNGLTATLSKNDAERLLEKWSQTGYVVSKRGYVHLGPRCIAEFAPYFRTHCQDYLNYCGLCSDVVFTGETCGHCGKLMHRYCLERFLQKQKKCPNCKQDWNSENE